MRAWKNVASAAATASALTFGAIAGPAAATVYRIETYTIQTFLIEDPVDLFGPGALDYTTFTVSFRVNLEAPSTDDPIARETYSEQPILTTMTVNGETLTSTGEGGSIYRYGGDGETYDVMSAGSVVGRPGTTLYIDMPFFLRPDGPHPYHWQDFTPDDFINLTDRIGRFDVQGDGFHVWALFDTLSMTTSYIDLVAVPEPATWVLMLSGFGLAGAMLRRRRAVAV